MNFLTLPHDSLLSIRVQAGSLPHGRRAFRFPGEMHVPAMAARIEFSLEPELRWLAQSFVAWLRPPLTAEPPWLS